MKTSELVRISDQARTWPRFIHGWDDVPVYTTSLFVNRMVAGSLEPLSRFRRLRHLCVYGVREQDIDHVATLSRLKTLNVGELGAADLRWLQSLPDLESLGIRHAARLKSFWSLESLQKLRHFYCYHIPNVRSLDPLRFLGNLQEIVLEMSMGTNKQLRFKSLQPLSNLPRLRCVDLRGVEVEDRSLAPLATLLRYLFPCSYTFNIDELAFLAAKLNGQLAKEDRITPTRKIPGDQPAFRCRKCEAPRIQLVGTVGAKYRLLACARCDEPLIARNTAIFDGARRHTGQQIADRN